MNYTSVIKKITNNIPFLFLLPMRKFCFCKDVFVFYQLIKFSSKIVEKTISPIFSRMLSSAIQIRKLRNYFFLGPYANKPDQCSKHHEEWFQIRFHYSLVGSSSSVRVTFQKTPLIFTEGYNEAPYRLYAFSSNGTNQKNSFQRSLYYAIVINFGNFFTLVE